MTFFTTSMMKRSYASLLKPAPATKVLSHGYVPGASAACHSAAAAEEAAASADATSGDDDDESAWAAARGAMAGALRSAPLYLNAPRAFPISEMRPDP